MLKNLVLISIPVCLSALLMACGRNGDDNGIPVPLPTTETSAAPAGAATATEEPIARSVNSESLHVFLLQLEDLPSGYSAFEDTAEDDVGSEECQNPIKAPAQAEVNYRQSDFGPFIFHLVSAYPNSLEAELAVEATKQLLASDCASTTNEDGSVTTMAEASWPELGDDVLAFNISVSDGIFPASGRFVAVREGQFITVLMMFGLMAPDLSPLEELVEKAESKLP